MSEEARLIQDILKGDIRAFRQLITQYEALVGKMVYRMIGQAEVREEVAQDVYLAIYQRLDGFRFESKLSTWIARIAYYKCVDYYKKRGKSPGWEVLEEGIDSEISTFSEPVKTPLQELELQERQHLLEHYIAQLPASYRTILHMYHSDELSYKEIGETMNMPSGTVKNYLFRARKLLKKALEELYRKGELDNE